MSDGDDDAPAEDAPEDDGAAGEEVTVESLEQRFDAAEEALEAAETEADLDDVEETLNAIETDLETADLPEPDDEDDDAEDPRADLESRLDELRDGLEEARGPYAEDVVDAVDAAVSTIEETRWTERGESEVADAVSTFAESVSETLEESFTVESEDPESLVATLDDVAGAVGDAGLDADEDAETIAALLEATEALSTGLEDAQEWDDLQVHEQLEAEGFYDCLGHYKDYPPEWSAVKEWEQQGNAEMILLALEKLGGSGFMEEHCLEALTRLGDPAAFEEMHGRAGKRNKPAIKALGKMGDDAEEALETLLDYVDADSDPALQKVTFKALGEIGSEEATQALADKLEMDNDNVRPYAARALGLIGDTRAVDPLAATLADDEEDTVRAAAAWALRQIGTESALEAAADYADDPSFLVQNEAERAEDSLSSEQATAA